MSTHFGSNVTSDLHSAGRNNHIDHTGLLGYTKIDQGGLLNEGGCTIHQAFANLDPDKQARILKAAYKEFAQRGFTHASTNRIVKEAGIGKGMLFYYFKSKKELFLYLIEHGINYILNEYLPLLDDRKTDIIEKCMQAARVKMEAYARHPELFNFFGALYLSSDVKLSEDLAVRLKEIRNLVYSKRFTNIDTTVFRDDVPPEAAMKLIHWALEGYESELINRIKGKKHELSSIDFTPYWEEFYCYLGVLKRVFYKPEEI